MFANQPAAVATGSCAGLIERIGFYVTLGAVGAFFVWIAGFNGATSDPEVARRNYYDLLAQGFLEGHLHLKTDVPQTLAELANPYEPGNRPPGLELHDASFFKGKYYLYYGPVPAVALFAPYRLLTGTPLPPWIAAVLFCGGGFVASLTCWRLIQKRYFPRACLISTLLSIGTLGFLSLAPVLIRRSRFYELSIGSGYCFAMLALLAAYLALHSARRATLWFAASGLAFGLAVGSRPTYAFAVAFLIPPLLWYRKQAVRDPTRPFAIWRGGVMASAIAVGTMAASIGLYNHLRFGSPFEFGQTYVLGSFNYTTLKKLSFTYVPFNMYIYLLAEAQWSQYFPFIGRHVIPSFRPAVYGDLENVYGLVNTPFLALAIVPIAWALRPGQDGARSLSPWIFSAGLLFIGVFGTTVFFCGASVRYLVDFFPALALLSGVGVLLIEKWLGSSDHLLLRTSGWLVLFLAFVLSIGFVTIAYFRLPQTLQARQPHLYEDLVRFFMSPDHSPQNPSRR